MISQCTNVLFIGVVIRYFTLLMTDEQAAMFCPNTYLSSGCILWLNLLIPTGAAHMSPYRSIEVNALPHGSIRVRFQTGRYASMWVHAGQHVSIRDNTGPYIWVHPHQYGSFHTGPYGFDSIRVDARPCGSMRGNAGPYGPIRDHTSPYGASRNE